jgi:lipoprotein signal peptidase
MIVAGALGNLFDRWLNGFTTDYIILFRTSAINLSDVLIVVGMLAFLWYHKGNPSERQTS